MLKHNIDFVYCILPEIIRSFLCTIPTFRQVIIFNLRLAEKEFNLVVQKI